MTTISHWVSCCVPYCNNRKLSCSFSYYFLRLKPVILYNVIFKHLLAGTDKSDSADKVAEKLEDLSVKEESKASEKKEVKEKSEEKQ